MNCHYGRLCALVEPVVAIGLLLILVDGFQNDTLCATGKLQIIRLLTKFRVRKTTTLKTLNMLMHNQLRGVLCIHGFVFLQIVCTFVTV